jgi:hypothetical protein
VLKNSVAVVDVPLVDPCWMIGECCDSMVRLLSYLNRRPCQAIEAPSPVNFTVGKEVLHWWQYLYKVDIWQG